MNPLVLLAGAGLAYWLLSRTEAAVPGGTTLTPAEQATYQSLGLNVPSAASGTAGPDYITTPHTREQVNRWSKTAMIAAGYWDPNTNVTTARYRSLPSQGGY